MNRTGSLRLFESALEEDKALEGGGIERGFLYFSLYLFISLWARSNLCSTPFDSVVCCSRIRILERFYPLFIPKRNWRSF